MEKQVYESKFIHLEKAIKTFTYALIEAKKHEKSDINTFEIYRDSVIQRFEYSYELSWKFMKFLWEYAEWEIEVRTASQAIKTAFRSWYIDNMRTWFNMMEYRNKTSHDYEENVANDLYNDCFKFNEELQKFYELIKLRYGQWYFRFD